MAASASLLGSPSALSAHPVGVQHAGSHNPLQGMGYHWPISCQHSGGVLGDPLHHGPSIISSGHLCPLWQGQPVPTLPLIKRTLGLISGSKVQYWPTNLQWPVIIQPARIHLVSRMASKTNLLWTLWSML